MADQFSIYQPGPETYVGFGITEGLRKHMEFMQQQKAQAERTAQFQAELNFRRQSAETEAMQRADELAQREKAFNKTAAAQEAELDFNKQKFKEDVRQWEAESPVRMEYLKRSGEAKETTAGAAGTRAKAVADKIALTGKGVYTPGGLGKLYADTYTKNFNEAAKTYGSNFENVYSDPELYKKVDEQANTLTRKAVTPYLNMYNEYVGTNPTAVGMPQMSFDDLEALPSVQAGKKKNNVDTSVLKDYNALKNDPTFTSRFESLDLTDKELDLLRLNAPDVLDIYKTKLKSEGQRKLQNKIAVDAAEKVRQERVLKNADKQ